MNKEPIDSQTLYLLPLAAAMVISISSFFWRLYPAIKKMDENEQIDPKAYSKTLLAMIVAFIISFVVIIIIELVKYM
ncbi:MAG: hypothetical protein JEZ04_19945 [Spirochaetales bacterium]|nr:hypothetical protein [Spirochaetales bacterium]